MPGRTMVQAVMSFGKSEVTMQPERAQEGGATVALIKATLFYPDFTASWRNV